MIFKNNEKFSLVQSKYFTELKKAFPEIEEKKNVIMEVLPNLRDSVPTDRGTTEYFWPEKMSLMKFAAMENGEPVTFLYQQTEPAKKDNGVVVFKKTEMSVMHTTRVRNMRIFNTDIDDVRNDLEHLFMLYFFCPEVLNGKACKDTSKARWRFKNEEKEALEIITRESNLAKVKMAITSADVNQLSALYTHMEGAELTRAQMNVNALKVQFIQQVSTKEEKLNKALEFFEGVKKGAVDTGLIEQAIELGVLVSSADGNDVVLKTTKDEKVFIEGVSISDVEAIATFVAKNGSKKGTLNQQIKIQLEKQG